MKKKILQVKLFSETACFIFIITSITAAMAFAYFYLQKTLGLPPCPLCIVDRLALILVALTLITGWVLSVCSSGKTYIIRHYTYLLNGLWLALGLWASGRHVFLQRFSSESGSCVPIIHPDILDLLTRAFAGTSNCNAILWTVMGWSIAEQTLLLFVLLSLLHIRLFYIAWSRDGSHGR